MDKHIDSVQKAKFIFTDSFQYSLWKMMPKGNIQHHISRTQNICWNFTAPFHILLYNLFTYFFLSKSNQDNYWWNTISSHAQKREQSQYDFILQKPFLQSFSSAETIAETTAQDLPANAMPTTHSSIFDRKQPWLRLFTEKVTHFTYPTS